MIILHYICRELSGKDGDATTVSDSWQTPTVGRQPQGVTFQYAYTVKELRNAISNVRPTIVNIHGCWSLAAWRAARQCKKYRIPYIITPHRQLEPWHIADRYWLQKLPMLAIFQKRMVQDAGAIIASTNQEKDNLTTLSLIPAYKRRKPLNANVAAITAASPDTTADEGALYQKVEDTQPFTAMDSNEIEAENILLRIGLAQDNLSRTLSEDEYKRVKELSDDSWRRILLHANDEGIIAEIRVGADILRLSHAETAITDIQRFNIATAKDLKPLKKDRAMMKPLHLEEVSDEEKASANDVLVMTVMLNLRHEIAKKRVSKRHIADTYSVLRFTDYDEDKVKRCLKRLNMLTFTRRILCILSEEMGLQEGFTPFATLDDRGTAKLRHALYMANIIALPQRKS